MAANGNETVVKAGLLLKLVLSLVISFVIGGVILYGVVSGQQRDLTAVTERMDRRDTVDREFRSGISQQLSEIRNLIQLQIREGGGNR